MCLHDIHYCLYIYEDTESYLQRNYTEREKKNKKDLTKTREGNCNVGVYMLNTDHHQVKIVVCSPVGSVCVWCAHVCVCVRVRVYECVCVCARLCACTCCGAAWRPPRSPPRSSAASARRRPTSCRTLTPVYNTPLIFIILLQM